MHALPGGPELHVDSLSKTAAEAGTRSLPIGGRSAVKPCLRVLTTIEQGAVREHAILEGVVPVLYSRTAPDTALAFTVD